MHVVSLRREAMERTSIELPQMNFSILAFLPANLRNFVPAGLLLAPNRHLCANYVLTPVSDCHMQA